MREVCSVIGVSRSHVTTRLRRPANWIAVRKARSDAEQLINHLLTDEHDRASYCYQRIWVVLRHQGVNGRKYQINHKRVYRIIRSLDYCNREVMSWEATTKRIDAQLVGNLMMPAVQARFGPEQTAAQPVERLSDNGSCYTAVKSRQFARMLGLKPVATPVVSPQSNGMAESFVKTFKRDYARLAERPDSLGVMAASKRRFEHSDENHPHNALQYLSPRRFREQQHE